MPKLPAYRANEFAGWIRVPENLGFGWVLRIPVTSRASVTFPVRVRTQDRGWTQFFFAELDGLASWQLDELVANDILEPKQDAAAA